MPGPAAGATEGRAVRAGRHVDTVLPTIEFQSEETASPLSVVDTWDGAGGEVRTRRDGCLGESRTSFTCTTVLKSQRTTNYKYAPFRSYSPIGYQELPPDNPAGAKNSQYLPPQYSSCTFIQASWTTAESPSSGKGYAYASPPSSPVYAPDPIRTQI